MQARPPGLAAVVVLDPLARELRGAGGDQRRIQPTGKQHPIRHVGHQLAMHGLLKRLAQGRSSHVMAARGGIVAPWPGVVAAQFAAGAVVDMTRRERRHVGTHADQRLHLRGHAQAALRVVAPVQRADADRVARDQVALRLAVPQREREDAVEPAHEVAAVLAIQRVDHLAVRSGGEFVAAGRTQFAVVVDLAVHRQRQRAVARTQRLRAAGRVDDGQPLVHQDHPGVDEHPAPVRPAMTLALRQFQRLPAERGQVVARLQVEYSEYRAHGGSFLVAVCGYRSSEKSAMETGFALRGRTRAKIKHHKTKEARTGRTSFAYSMKLAATRGPANGWRCCSRDYWYCRPARSCARKAQWSSSRWWRRNAWINLNRSSDAWQVLAQQ